MSSYNNIEKIKYTNGTSEVVNLLEYIVFEDERAEEKYIVFKFINNVTQQLLGMEFEVSQYNIDGSLIETSIVIYDKLLAKSNVEFVPNAKLKVNYACKTISIKLRKAAYDRFLWNEGEYEDNSYKFEHYHRDEQSRHPAVKAEEEDKKEKGKKKKKKAKDKRFELKDQTKKNIARFPAVFLAFVFIVVSAFVGVSLYFFKKQSDKFTLEDFKLRVVSGKTVSIYGYEGKDTELEIPAAVGEYSVVKIDSGAFTNSHVEKITISTSLTIEKAAFVNCKELVSISSSYSITLMCTASELCVGCTPQIYLPNAHYLEG